MATTKVTRSVITSDAISGAEIADDAIDSEHYVDGSIDTAHLAADAVTGAKIADDAIDSEHYVDGSIDTAHLAADAVTGAKIADDAIDSEHYTDASIDAAHIASNAVTSAKINADAVTGAKIADDAIDSEHYAAGSIDEAHIADNAVTLAKMAGGTDGTIITFDASGNPTAVGPGTDGQVLTSTGSGSPPAFEAAAASGKAVTESSSDPVITTNPSGGVGTLWLNTTTGYMWCCIDATSNKNKWQNLGDGSGTIALKWYGGRGLLMGGTTNTGYGGHTDNIHYITIASTGNSTDFGNLTVSRLGGIGTASNNSRLVMVSGNNNGSGETGLNTMDYVTVGSTGNATDFGDLLVACRYKSGVSDGTCGVYCGGYGAGADPGLIDNIDYQDVATTGNCSDFGDLIGSGGQLGQDWSNGTRSIVAATHDGSNNTIEYLTIQSTGNGTDFGDLTTDDYATASGGDQTRTVNASGNNTTVIDYVTTATTGNATDFGDLTAGRGVTSCADATTMVMISGRSSATTMDYITVQTTGNATDFGDCYTSEQMGAGSGD